MTNKCFVPGCKTGYESDTKKRKAEGKRYLSLFSIPRDLTQLQKWKKAIPRIDKELSKSDKVCELHFLGSDIIRSMVFKFPDGTEQSLERVNPVLSADAVPCIFPSLPAYMIKKPSKRKAPCVRLPLPEKPKKEAPPVEESTDIGFTFNYLVSGLERICKPNKHWAISAHEDEIICVKWDIEFSAERQIIIFSSFDILILYYGQATNPGLKITIDSIESVSALVKSVDELIICKGASNGNLKCCIYMQRIWGLYGRPKELCSECKTSNNKFRKKIKSEID